MLFHVHIVFIHTQKSETRVTWIILSYFQISYTIKLVQNAICHSRKQILINCYFRIVDNNYYNLPIKHYIMIGVIIKYNKYKNARTIKIDCVIRNTVLALLISCT